jgi:hypothetical protein
VRRSLWRRRMKPGEAWRCHDEDRGSGRVGVVAAPAERSGGFDLSIQTEVEVTVARVKGGTEMLPSTGVEPDRNSRTDPSGGASSAAC